MINFQNLIVWRKAVDFHKQLIVILNSFPREEIDCMYYQLRKASLGSSNNISEGCGSGSNQNLRYFLFISLGNIKEVESILIIARELKYLEENDFNNLYSKINELDNMLFSFIEKIN